MNSGAHKTRSELKWLIYPIFANRIIRIGYPVVEPDIVSGSNIFKPNTRYIFFLLLDKIMMVSLKLTLS